jgi:Pyruvate/2-oxoacid:ferredoxin oxidoreductase gamma subunit
MATATAVKTRTEILISGFGGQGVIRMGQILGLCAIKQGQRVTMLKSHGTETRGGYVRAQLVISPTYVDSPVVESADVFVAFSAPAYKKFFDLCRGKILYDPELVEQIRCGVGSWGGQRPSLGVERNRFAVEEPRNRRRGPRRRPTASAPSERPTWHVRDVLGPWA